MIPEKQIQEAETHQGPGEPLWAGGPVYQELQSAKLTGDSLLLADFASDGARGHGADLGCGTGILMLLLLWGQGPASKKMHPDLYMTGFELFEPAALTARENLKRNGLERRGEIRICDLRDLEAVGENGAFDFVVTNPPYFRTGRGGISASPARALARSGAVSDRDAAGQAAAGEDPFLRAARRLLKNGGRLYLCCRPDPLVKWMTELSALRLEPKRLRFVHHAPGKTASLCLLECRADGGPGLRVEPPLFLHDEDGGETAEYRKICHR